MHTLGLIVKLYLTPGPRHMYVVLAEDRNA